MPALSMHFLKHPCRGTPLTTAIKDWCTGLRPTAADPTRDPDLVARRWERKRLSSPGQLSGPLQAYLKGVTVPNIPIRHALSSNSYFWKGPLLLLWKFCVWVSFSIHFFKLHTIWMTERKRDRETMCVWERAYNSGSPLNAQMLTTTRNQIQELNLDLPHRWQEPNHLSLSHYFPGSASAGSRS